MYKKWNQRRNNRKSAMSIQTCLTRFGTILVMASSNFRTMSAASAKLFPTGSAKEFRNPSAAYPWCRTARIDPSGMVSVSGLGCANDQPDRTVEGRFFDLTQSTEWMEYIEQKENRMQDEGGAGAYDALRCDVIVSPVKGEADSRLRVWGEDFHLMRLQQSYKSLVKANKEYSNKFPETKKATLDEALERSHSILRALLAEAQLSASTTDERGKDNIIIQLFRVTLLWSPPSEASNGTDENIVVRGHACCSCKPIEIQLNPKSIVASVAVHSGHGDADATTIDANLPTRHANPQGKIAAWCRLRKKMENPETYKPDGVSEVLMVRNRKDDDGETRLEVLEGLSSNFFVVYKDGALRTATEGVLNGYVRHLVLECASKCGLKFDPRPIFLHETSQWKEVFITSSSRLIYPISSIVIPEEAATATSFREIWKDEVLNDDGGACQDSDTQTQRWQQLQNEILKTGGYDVSV
jgi:hypothetical protein